MKLLISCAVGVATSEDSMLQTRSTEEIGMRQCDSIAVASLCDAFGAWRRRLGGLESDSGLVCFSCRLLWFACSLRIVVQGIFPDFHLFFANSSNERQDWKETTGLCRRKEKKVVGSLPSLLRNLVVARSLRMSMLRACLRSCIILHHRTRSALPQMPLSGASPGHQC